ncbi:MAG: hypothetical protein JWO47_1076 [Candidatus Saccharibacteria bacterium]|nr:hypothetical protein [Candidatus Saccharibacteria bacterium]
MRLDGFTPHIAPDLDDRPVVASYGWQGPLVESPRPEDVRNLNVPKMFPSLGWFGMDPGAFDEIDAARAAEKLEAVVGSARISDDGVHAALDFRSPDTGGVRTYRFIRVPLLGNEE